MSAWLVGAGMIAGAFVLVAVLLQARAASRRAEPLARLEERVRVLTEQLGARVGESAQATGRMGDLMQRQLSDANRSLAELSGRIARLDEATRQVERVGRSIAGLEQILASPKLRGGMGEWSLESLLREVLPADRVARQYTLPTRGVVVDFAVFAADGRIVPIDAKFPLEAFRRLAAAENGGRGEAVDSGAPAPDPAALRRELHRSVRRRIDEIAERYICPEDGTLDFALMYIPAESIYYELAVRDEGAEFVRYAFARRVVPCSPNTLYAYLQAILLGLRGIRIAEHARAIQAALEHLRQDVGEACELFERAGGQLRYAGQNLDAAGDALGKVRARLDATLELPTAEPPRVAGADREGPLPPA